jgi:hypothetical protein
MQRRKVAIASAAGVAAVIVAALGVSYYVASSLQFRAAGGAFDPATLSFGALVDACNPTPLPASFDRYTISVYYGGDQFATISVPGRTIAPQSSETLRGDIDVDEEAVGGIVGQAIGRAFSGQPAEGSEVTARATLDSKMLGFVPLSQTRELDLSGGDTEFSCQT